jgi:acyl dehydratase
MEVMNIEMKDEKRGVIECKNSIKNQRGEDEVVYTTRPMSGRSPA